MAEVKPLKALHYNLATVTSLADVTAPPYDVIDARQRAALLARSPFNVVEIDLPEAPAGGDPYEHADETLEAWTLESVLAADREPAIWALTQEYSTPAGGRLTRRGFLARVRVTDYGPGIVSGLPGPPVTTCLRSSPCTRAARGSTSSRTSPVSRGARSPMTTGRPTASGGSETPPCMTRSPPDSPMRSS
jgi:hypothetical protein